MKWHDVSEAVDDPNVIAWAAKGQVRRYVVANYVTAPRVGFLASVAWTTTIGETAECREFFPTREAAMAHCEAAERLN